MLEFSEMRDLDETGMEIISLLAEDVCRPFSKTSEGGGPLRVSRLRPGETAPRTGIINGFTIDVNRAHLRTGVPVLVQFENPTDAVQPLQDRLSGADIVEHVFVTAEGKLWFYARAKGQNVRRWVEGLLDDTPAAEYSVTLLDDVE